MAREKKIAREARKEEQQRQALLRAEEKLRAKIRRERRSQAFKFNVVRFGLARAKFIAQLVTQKRRGRVPPKKKDEALHE